MREDNLSLKMFNYLSINSGSLELHDQAGFNKMVNNKWIKVDLKWNLQSFVMMSKYKFIDYSRDTVKNAIHNPKIIHYSARIKPWQYVDNSLYRKYYYQFLELTPWKDFIPLPKSYKDYFYRFFLKFTPKWFFLFLLHIKISLGYFFCLISKKNE